MAKASIIINPLDNVAVALRDLKKGEVHEGVELCEDITKGHKFALRAIKKGEEVIKYGSSIAYATRDIPAGAHVHTHNVHTNLSGEIEYAYHPNVRPLAPVPPETFMGYRRKDSRAAIRNEIWIIPTVGCVNGIAEKLADMLRAETRCEGVDAIRAFTHNYGCSQLGDDHENTRRILRNMVLHPNAGAVLIVGLGCENNRPEAFREMPAEETLAVDKEDVENLVFGDRTSGFLTYDNTTTVDDVYYNDKVPFAYDYADKDPDVFPSYSSHGMHVAGIIAGNSVETMYDNDGKPLLDADGNELNFRGVAPQAQLAICKVFTDDDKSDVLGGAEQVDILAALEDCIKLGVDVINMSLGSSAGFAQEEDEYTAGVYARIREAGISLVVAASNDYSSGYGGPTGTNLTSNPDAGTVGAPSTYDESFSVANPLPT